MTDCVGERLMSGEWEGFRGLPRADLGAAHAVLVDELRALIERHGQPLDGLGEAVRHRLGKKVPARPGQRISALADGSRFPSADELRAIVAVCTGSAPAQLERFAKLRAAAAAERETARRAGILGSPSSAVRDAAADSGARVGAARDWVRLGVHQPITQLSDGTDMTDQVRAGRLPDYVLRTVDEQLLRPALAAAARGEAPAVRLVVVTGESTAGKTRAAVEGARAELADWTLVVPHGPADLMALLDPAAASPRRVLVFLDEVQHFLADPAAATTLARLLELPAGPVVLLATLRSDAEAALTGTPGAALLRPGRALRVPLRRRPDPDELARARALAEHDPWLREALGAVDDGYGIAEWLAAGPQLLDHLDRARTSDTDPVARTAAAIVDAAIDCYRAGYTRPVPEPLLREAHQLYLPLYSHTAGQTDPFLEALAWARAPARHSDGRPIAGATSLLIHLPVRGDTAFDYLLDPADPDGTSPWPPDTPNAAPSTPSAAVHQLLWPILLRHVTQPTRDSLATAAVRHGRREVVRELIRRNPANVDLLRAVGDAAGLVRRADAGDPSAAQRLAWLLAERGDELELARRADAGDPSAAEHLARLLAERGDEPGLTRRADAGDQPAAEMLVWLLVKRVDEPELARRADAGDPYAAEHLAWLLAERGDEPELTRRADAGDQPAAQTLVWLLAERGDEPGLARRADAGDPYAAERLVWLLVERGDEPELTRRADAGDQYAARRLAWLLAKRAEADDPDAARRLVWLLAKPELARRADAGDQPAAQMLVWLLAERG